MFIPPQKIFTYYNQEFRLKKTSNNWYAFDCPFCNDGKKYKMAVHFHYSWVKCYTCDYHESVLDFLHEYEGWEYREARSKLMALTESMVDFRDAEDSRSTINYETISALDLPYGYTPLLDGDTALGDRARKYLADRGFNLKELDRLGFGYCISEATEDMSDDEDYFGYIIVPVKAKGRLLYYIGRDFIGNYLRYKNPKRDIIGIGKEQVIFNSDALRIYGEVFIFEGWSDAATIGRQACATFGYKWSKDQKDLILNSEADRLVIVPDAGVDGQGKRFYVHALETAMSLLDHKEVAVVDMDTLAEFGKDVNAVGKDKFMEVYRKTESLTYTSAAMAILNS